MPPMRPQEGSDGHFSQKYTTGAIWATHRGRCRVVTTRSAVNANRIRFNHRRAHVHTNNATHKHTHTLRHITHTLTMMLRWTAMDTNTQTHETNILRLIVFPCSWVGLHNEPTRHTKHTCTSKNDQNHPPTFRWRGDETGKLSPACAISLT